MWSTAAHACVYTSDNAQSGPSHYTCLKHIHETCMCTALMMDASAKSVEEAVVTASVVAAQLSRSTVLVTSTTPDKMQHMLE